MMMNDILKKILDVKKEEVAELQKNFPLNQLKEKISSLPKTRDFTRAIRNHILNHQLAVIAEIKKASPSQGVIRENFDPVSIALSYQKAGAACLSILTDRKFFQGSPDYLQQVREVCDLPLLRKDFIIDAYQIYESRAIGADCILLIVSALSDEQLAEFSDLARELGLAVLIEVHDAEELTRALALNSPLIGVNNRNLKTFQVDIQTTLSLSKQLTDEHILIAESGIHTRADVKLLRDQHVNAFLVGESLMRAENPGGKLQEIFG
jgi:indole-3-glycerol phosphate synthase